MKKVKCTRQPTKTEKTLETRQKEKYKKKDDKKLEHKTERKY